MSAVQHYKSAGSSLYRAILGNFILNYNTQTFSISAMIAMNEELFNIWTYDQSGKKKNTNHITVPAPVDKDGDATLATIRELLIKGKLDSKK